MIRITTDGWYRLQVNGRWVADGPCRSWPEHFQYDVLDVTDSLQPGPNEITVTAWHWNAGNFHTIPQQAGLLVQLDGDMVDGSLIHIPSDATWDLAEATGWVAETPKVSVQMEPQELYDARRVDALEFTPAKELYHAGEGPWKDLQPARCGAADTPAGGIEGIYAANLYSATMTLLTVFRFHDWCIPAWWKLTNSPHATAVWLRCCSSQHQAWSSLRLKVSAVRDWW